MTVFLTWPFKATGASTARTMPDRLADVVNIKDYGAIGDGSHNDTTNIQAAIDAAFGTAGSPHGTSSYLNRPLRIPYGNYLISSPLVLTEVKGGQIIGDGMYSTIIAGSNSIFTVNGCEDTVFSGFATSTGPVLSTTNGRHGISLNAGSTLGLKNITLADVFCEGGQYGLRIASGNASPDVGGTGGENIFLKGFLGIQNDTGLSIEGASCSVNALAGAISECTRGVRIRRGSFLCCLQFAGTTQLDIQHDSTGTTTIYGVRTESRDFVNTTDGRVVVIGCLHASAAVGYAVNVTSPGVVRLISCALGNDGTPTQSYITGTGNVFLKNVEWMNGSGPIFLSSFTGKICEFVSDIIFTFAQLPTVAKEGLTVNVSNSNTATWGATITTTGANHVLARYNGSNWTVVGK